MDHQSECKISQNSEWVWDKRKNTIFV